MWQGTVKTSGYPAMSTGELRDVFGTDRTYTHRIAYVLFVGDLRADQEIHHACGRRTCLNPEHLAAVTLDEHLAAHRADTCPSGHHANWRKDSRGWRRCRTCERGKSKRGLQASPPSSLPFPVRLQGGLYEIEQAMFEGVVDRVCGERLCCRIRVLLEQTA